MNKYGLHSTRVLLDGTLKEATVVIQGSSIVEIHEGAIKERSFEVYDHGTDVIMPGLIDSHVHINQPGRTEWEGFDTATKAAAAGGITTLVDMPLNSSPVTTSASALEQKIQSAEGKLHVNCGFYGGVIPANADSLEDLLKQGVMGIKAFLTHSGIDEFPNVTEADLRKALPVIKQHNSVLLVHCELESDHSQKDILKQQPTSYRAYLKSRPRKWEDDAIALMIRLSEEFDVRVHVVHLSSSDSIGPLMEAQRRGVPITVETCPQYLCLNAEDIPDGDTRFKCAPPIREKENNDRLWAAVKDGLIDFIVTDHSPAPPGIKALDTGDLEKAWGGIASLQFSLPVFWTEAEKRGFIIADISRLMSENVAKFLGLHHQKGKLSPGMDADLVIWDPEKSLVIREEDIEFRHKITPYAGQKVRGEISQTFVAGELVYDRGSFVNLSKGKTILKKE